MTAPRTARAGAPPATARNARRRAGFTLVELLVAITLLSVGALALASLSAVVMRNLNGAAQQTIAATIAQSRFERLRSSPCMALSSGDTTRRGMREVWKVVEESRSITVILAVSYDDGRRKRTQVYETIIPCPALQ